MRDLAAWMPAVLLGAGLALVGGARQPQEPALRADLSTVPASVAGLEAVDLQLTPEELAANGASAYLLRSYRDAGGVERLGLYVGYYPRQSQGRTIHSPKNCLPGGGWEPMSSSIVSTPVPGGEVPVNRYLIANDAQRALVYYWYQGRGRVAASEYAVKWELLRDAALSGRTEEALVRLVVPLGPDEPEDVADRLAREAAATLVPALAGVLPD